MEIRVLVENPEASIIIGKSGSNAKAIRDGNEVYISLLKNEVLSVKERVMLLKGPLTNVSNALFHVARLLAESKTTTPKPEEQPDTVTFRILIHKFLAGAIIGKAGDISKQIQADTGARMRVSNEPLAGSTEKVVTLSGTPEVIHAASLKVLQQLNDNPLRTGCVSMPYKPGAATVPSYPGFPPHSQYLQNPPSPYPQNGAYGQQYSGYPDPSSHYPSHHSQYQQPTASYAADKKVEKIVIPTASAGTVIGSRGSIIRDIKQQSGCNISIAAAEATKPDERVVTISGSANGIQTAIYLIRQRIERPTFSTYLS